MFDIAFSELVVIAVVALIVIGPEKLPKVARTLGALAGRMQKYVAQVKEEVNREVRFQELQQLQQEIKETASKTQASFQRKADALTQELDFEDLNTENKAVDKEPSVEAQDAAPNTVEKVIKAKKVVKKTTIQE